MSKSMLQVLRSMIIDGKLTFYVVIVIVILIPLHAEYIPPFIILWALLWIAEGYFKTFQGFKFREPAFVLLMLFLLFYLLQAAGLLYSENKSKGILMVFRSLSYFIFPFLLLSPNERIKRNTKLLLKIFAVATTIYIVFCLAYALKRSIHFSESTMVFNPVPVDNYWNNYFFGPEFSYRSHPSYVAMYVILSIFIVIDSFFERSEKLLLQIMWLFVALFLAGSLYFLSSRAGIITLIVLLPVYFTSKFTWIKRKSFYIITYLVLITSMASLFITNNKVREYFRVQSGNTTIEILQADERFSYWKSSIEVISDNPFFGVGIGDSCDELTKKFNELGFTKGYYGNMNAHNQYLETLMNSGLLGLILFLSTIGFIFYISIKGQNIIYALFISMMVIFFLFESILNRLAGVSFFSLFSFLLIHLETSVKGKDKD